MVVWAVTSCETLAEVRKLVGTEGTGTDVEKTQTRLRFPSINGKRA
jgi:hypothetical protein